MVLFSEYIGLFSEYIGLFSEYIKLFSKSKGGKILCSSIHNKVKFIGIF